MVRRHALGGRLATSQILKSSNRGRNRKGFTWRVEALEPRQLLSTISWINPSSSNWNVATNWSSGTLPTINDDVAINIAGVTVSMNGGVVSLCKTINVGTGATLLVTSDAGILQVASNLTSSGGVIKNEGTLELDSDMTLNFTSGTFICASTLNTEGHTITNTGTILCNNRTDGLALETVISGDGTFINNGHITVNNMGIDLNGSSATITHFDNASSGVVEFQDNGRMIPVAGDTSHGGTFTNEGTILKTGGTGNTTIRGFTFSNSGTIEADVGTINLESLGGTSTGGNLVAASGAMINLGNNGDVHLQGTYTGSGAGSVQINSVVLDGATTFNFPSGLANWPGTIDTAGHTLTNAGSITLSNALNGLAVGSSLKGDGTFINNGTVMSNNMGLELQGSSATATHFDKAAPGTYQFINNSRIIGSGGDASHGGTFTNEGKILKTGGTSNSFVRAVTFSNSGTIQVDTGNILLIPAAGTSTGGNFVVAAGSNLFLNDPNVAAIHYQGTYTGSGAGNIVIASGSVILDADTTFNFPVGLLSWQGTINSAGHTLTNTGSMTVTGGTIVFAGNGALVNQGTLTLASTLNITGTFVQSSGGTLVEQLSGSNAGQFGKVTVTGPATITGTLGVLATNNFVPTSALNAPFLSATSVSGTFSTVTNLTPSTNYNFAADYTTPNTVAVVLSSTPSPVQSAATVKVIGALPAKPLVAGRRIVPIRQLIQVTNSGGTTLSGLFAVQAFLSTDSNGASNSGTLLPPATRRVILRPKASFFVPLLVPSVPESAVGTFHIVATATDPAGGTAVGTSAAAITTLAPFTDLAGTALRIPPTAFAGRSALLVASIIQNGNIPIVGKLTCEVFASANGVLDTNSIDLGPVTRPLVIQAGGKATVLLPISVANATKGAYTIFVTLDPANVLGDTDLSNNTLKSQMTISVK